MYKLRYVYKFRQMYNLRLMYKLRYMFKLRYMDKESCRHAVVEGFIIKQYIRPLPWVHGFLHYFPEIWRKKDNWTCFMIYQLTMLIKNLFLICICLFAWLWGVPLPIWLFLKLRFLFFIFIAYAVFVFCLSCFVSPSQIRI